jgi:hypothetical protein
MLTRHQLSEFFLSWLDFSRSIASISRCLEGYLQGTARKKPRRPPAALRFAATCPFSVVYFSPQTVAAVADDQGRSGTISSTITPAVSLLTSNPVQYHR